MRKIFFIIAAMLVTLGFTACHNDDELDSTSIFPTEPPVRDAFDEWLLKNYTTPYNVEFKYKWEDIESDMKYNLVPADSAMSAKLAIIVKYMWFDAYAEVAGPDFVKSNVPRIINLIGSPAYNSEGTVVLGTAEGGLKVTLYMVNSLSGIINNYASLNDYYFHTMHHEFTHILNQKKPYDPAFGLITESSYISGDWYAISDDVARSKGFVTPYAMSEPREDFAEMFSVYVTSSPEGWNEILKQAGSGAAAIEEKLRIVRNYMRDSWNFDIDELRDAVMHRADELPQLNLETLN